MTDISRQDVRDVVRAIERLTSATEQNAKATIAVARMLKDIRDDARSRDTDNPLDFLESLLSPGETDDDDLTDEQIEEREQNRKFQREMEKRKEAEEDQRNRESVAQRVQQTHADRIAAMPQYDGNGDPIVKPQADAEPEYYLDQYGIRVYPEGHVETSVEPVVDAEPHYALTGRREDYEPLPEDEQWRRG